MTRPLITGMDITIVHLALRGDSYRTIADHFDVTITHVQKRATIVYDEMYRLALPHRQLVWMEAQDYRARHRSVMLKTLRKDIGVATGILNDVYEKRVKPNQTNGALPCQKKAVKKAAK